MKTDRCGKIDLILADAAQIALNWEKNAFDPTRFKMIRRRIAKLTDEELREILTLLVEFEHHPNDVYRENITNKMLVSVLKTRLVNNQTNIHIYNEVKADYQKNMDKLADHSLINRMTKVNKAVSKLKKLRKEYPMAQKYDNNNILYSQSKETYDARIKFYNLAVEFNRMIEHFDEAEKKLLKNKCKFSDFVHPPKDKDVSMCDMLTMVVKREEEFYNIRNDVNANQKII